MGLKVSNSSLRQKRWSSRRDFLRAAFTLGCAAAIPETYSLCSSVQDDFPVRFEDVAAKAGLTGVTTYGDVSHSLDIFKTNFSDDLPNLYHNDGNRLYIDNSQNAGLVAYSQLLGWGAGFFDANNDGWSDILYVNGHVYPEIEGLHGTAHYRQPKVLYQNMGNGRFRDVSAAGGSGITNMLSARGCAFGDFDNDGVIDVLVNPINAAPQLLHCTSRTGNHWITLKLVGTKSNKSAIGARVTCVTGDHRQIEEVRSGGSFYSQNDLRIHFGLGKATRIERLEVQWPSNQVDHFTELPTNQFLKLVEGSTKAIPVEKAKR